MARKNVALGHKLVSGQSLDDDFETEPMNVDFLDNGAIIIQTNEVTDNTGSFAVQVRIKKDALNYSEWATLSLDTTPTLADGDDVFAINLNQLPFSEFRIAFTAAGGTPDGTCDIWVMAKQIGG